LEVVKMKIPMKSRVVLPAEKSLPQRARMASV
jgi:hypothetical protein